MVEKKNLTKKPVKRRGTADMAARKKAESDAAIASVYKFDSQYLKNKKK